MAVCGVKDPVAVVMSDVRSDMLPAWRGDDEDAAMAPTRIESHVFVHGMTIHRSGRLTKGDVPNEQYLTLGRVGTGPVWFHTEDLRRLGLLPAVAPRTSVVRFTEEGVVTSNPRRQRWLAWFKTQPRGESNWVWAADLAEWYGYQGGSSSADQVERRRANAYQQLFCLLLRAVFVERDKRPHWLNELRFSRLLPEHAKLLLDLYCDRNRYGEPVLKGGEPCLADDTLRELMNDVWLPSRLVPRWCQDRNIKPPSWLAPQDANAMQARGTTSIATEPQGVPQVQQSDNKVAGNSVSDRTGAPGRPTSRHLVEREFRRRAEADDVCDTLRKEALTLSRWLETAHPGYAPMRPKTVENCIREEYRRLKVKMGSKII
jgi:hypothetical protein